MHQRGMKGVAGRYLGKLEAARHINKVQRYRSEDKACSQGASDWNFPFPLAGLGKQLELRLEPVAGLLTILKTR